MIWKERERRCFFSLRINEIIMMMKEYPSYSDWMVGNRERERKGKKERDYEREDEGKQ